MEQFIFEMQSIAAKGVQTFNLGEGFSLLNQIGGTGKCNLYYV